MQIKLMCDKCKINPVIEPKLIAYYYNGKTVYHELCKECMRARWMNLKDLPK